MGYTIFTVVCSRVCCRIVVVVEVAEQNDGTEDGLLVCVLPWRTDFQFSDISCRDLVMMMVMMVMVVMVVIVVIAGRKTRIPAVAFHVGLGLPIFCNKTLSGKDKSQITTHYYCRVVAFVRLMPSPSPPRHRLSSVYLFCTLAKAPPPPPSAFSGFAGEGDGLALPSGLLSEKLTVHGGRRVAEGGPRWYSYRQSTAIRVPS